MSPPTVFAREAGSGPTVFCLHSNASHSGQWRSLMDRLAGRFRVVAIDSYGSGRTPEWPSDRTITLADEVALAMPLLDSAGPKSWLVGHSYGAAVALKWALAAPDRFAGLALYEPTVFALVDAASPPPNGTEGIKQAVADAAGCLDAGDANGAARAFINYWMGAGTFERMPPDRQAPIAQSVKNVRRWAHALVNEPAPLADFARLPMPVLYMTGGRSPRPGHAVADLLLPALAQAEHVEFPKLGHMGPVTHPQEVDAAIEAFLLRPRA